MNYRALISFAAIGATVAVLAYDLEIRHDLRLAATKPTEGGDRAAKVERANREHHEEMKPIGAKSASKRDPGPANAARAGAGTGPAVGKTNPAADGAWKAAVIAQDPELRELTVRSYVAERRMTFAGLLYRLRLTPVQLQRFDAIQAEYQQGMLDLVAAMSTEGMTDTAEAAPLRGKLAETRDDQLRELFGDSFGAWEEANRTLAARSTVGQLLQEAFEAGGPLDNAQSEKLIAIAAGHRRTGPRGGYDWPAVSADAATVLSGSQLEAFRTAASYHELSEQVANLGRVR